MFIRFILKKFNCSKLSINFCQNLSGTRNFSSRKCYEHRTKPISKTVKMVDSRMRELMKPFMLGDYEYQQVYNIFTEHIDLGLKRKTLKRADTKCYVTFIHQIPTGLEAGKFLALDLGGTNFRVLLLFLRGNCEPEISSEVFTLSKELITGDGKNLFDYIAKCLFTFAKEHGVEQEELPIGFCFSFPCMQTSLETGILVRWTKGFSAPGVVGEDVGRLLKEAIARIPGMKVGRIAILNDTTGTLMSCAHRNPNCTIGLIIGTGCNACYIEKIENTDKMEDRDKKGHKHIILNIEWGAFGDSGCLDFIRTEFDKEIDAPTLNAGYQLYEKLIAGMYLGGLVRLNMLKAIKTGLMFEGHAKRKKFIEKLEKDKDCFPTNFLSEIEGDKSRNFTVSRRIFKGLFGVRDVHEDDCRKLLFICDVLSQRAARLSAVGLASLINRINDPFSVVAIDGSVYRFHPKFDKLMRHQMDKMVNIELDYDLVLSEDGSGRGAALAAAVAAAKSRKVFA